MTDRDTSRLPKRSAYDFVIVGAGANGLGLAAYLSKWGFSVCALDSRPEIGGGAENVEPVPGYSIDPHASFFYGRAAPGVEQLSLGRYGFRLSQCKGGFVGGPAGCFGSRDLSMLPEEPEDFARMGYDVEAAKLGAEFNRNLRARLPELLRSLYWTPPYDASWGIAKADLPSVKIFRDIFPAWDDSLLDMSLYEWVELMGVPDPHRCGMLINAWGNGPHPYWKGMALPAFGVGQLMGYTDGIPVTPVGGMHALVHALARCALSHGARIFVNAPVSEVLVRDGQAVGVRVADDTALEEKTIRANLGVIFAVHVKLLPGLVTPGALAPDFIQRVEDLSLKGGSLWVANLIVSEFPRFTAAPEIDGQPITNMVLNASTPSLLELMRDVHTFGTHPTEYDHYAGIWYICHGSHDPTRVRGGAGYVLDVNLQVPAPEDHRDGPDAVNRARDEIVGNIKRLLREYAPNMTDDKYLGVYVNSPLDIEQRNMAFVGGNWMGMRESEQEWAQNKPLPEVARYRTPVDGLYLCHQTSHPGGLCLLAVPYNLMHILQEDYEEIAKTTPEWWYPSPWHLTDKEAAGSG